MDGMQALLNALTDAFAKAGGPEGSPRHEYDPDVSRGSKILKWGEQNEMLLTVEQFNPETFDVTLVAKVGGTAHIPASLMVHYPLQEDELERLEAGVQEAYTWIQKQHKAPEGTHTTD